MRVLIVEDDPLTAIDMAASLEDGGHRAVAIAERFSEAIAVADATPIDVAIVDIGLKDGGTGVQLVGVLKSRYGIPSVLVSAEPELDSKADAAGAAGFISKPARPSEILRFVRAAAATSEAFC